MVEAANGRGEKRTTVQPIALKLDGTRAPALERRIDQVMKFAPTNPILTPTQRLAMFGQVVEITLERELKHKGLVSSEGSYSAELIGYIELV